MAFDFPASPSIGTTYSPAGGPSYIWNGTAWQVYGASPPVATADTRNRVINPAMQISQENADDTASTNNYWPADMWPVIFGGVTPVVSVQRFASVTPNGSKYRIHLAVTTADTSIAAGDYYTVRHYIEGINISDLRWGTANAKPIVLRFGFSANTGTYAVGLTSLDRSYVVTLACGFIFRWPPARRTRRRHSRGKRVCFSARLARPMASPLSASVSPSSMSASMPTPTPPE